MSNAATIVDKIIIPHTAFSDAARWIERCYAYSVDNVEAEGLAIVGDSGTGKTTVLKQFLAKHPSYRDSNGMVVPVLSASVPSTPTVKSLAGVMLAGLEDPNWERGTESEKSKRLRVLMLQTGTRMVMVDEFQHFRVRGTQKIMSDVADWLKLMLDETKTTLVVAGLPTCMAVIDSNCQLARRFLTPVQLPRFRWDDISDRTQLKSILKGFHTQINKSYEVPQLYTDDMAFRFYLATGGLMGYLSKLLREALRTADIEKRTTISFNDFNVAHKDTVWSLHRNMALPRPFDRNFQRVNNEEMMALVKKIGVDIEIPPISARCNPRSPRRESASAALVSR
jgi:DNA transposition AAA+ family ATPase